MFESSDGAQPRRTAPGTPPDRSAAGPPCSLGECDERLRFEMLVTDVAARLCYVASDQLDAEIEDAQRRVCADLGLDISAAWQWDLADPGVMVLTHLYRAIDGPPTPDRMEAAHYFPWATEEAKAGRIVVLASVEDLPPAGARDLETFRHFGVRTTLNIPLRAGSEPPFGVISFNDVRATRQWEPRLVGRLQLLAQVMAGAILRQRSEQILRLSEARLGLAADSAGAGLWSLNLETGRFWVTDRTRQTFGLPSDVVVDWERVLAAVHPEDRQRVEAALAELARTGEETSVEYRLQKADGRERWLFSRGRLHRRTAAESGAVVMSVTLDVTARKQSEAKLRASLAEVRRLRDQLQVENSYLRVKVQGEVGPGAIIGESEPIRRMLAAARSVAPTDTAVLITGETGTGKELLAQAIHDLSPRRGRTMVRVNCAALPAALIESELFGREKGAYTGAMTRQAGRFEVAHESTILLDEIGDLPLDLQAKLLRVLQDGSFERLGSNRTIRSKVRVIAATNRDLAAMVAAGTFREDLFHRLNVFPIAVPALRERDADIPLLVWAFVNEFNERMGRNVDAIPRAVMERLRAHPWPGNVRELRNAIERAMITNQGRSLDIALTAPAAGLAPLPSKLHDVERQHILAVLDRAHWRISGKGGAAEILGLVPTTLHSRLQKLGIKRPGR